MARGMGRLAVAGAHPAAPPAPAAARSAPAQQPAAAPPVSSKGIPHPARPGFGKLGRRVVVRANHFLVEVADNDICHYNVSSPPLLPIYSCTFVFGLFFLSFHFRVLLDQ